MAILFHKSLITCNEAWWIFAKGEEQPTTIGFDLCRRISWAVRESNIFLERVADLTLS
jgi:hypothetical protein